ncbi:hypothetical protein B0A50_08797 [Salinomyces thailandicus]|uniref:POPLD-domain-containing protein n=1 Tax=Salinomyces thailandicus TaxID=706561 RepID=A0A4U0TIR2_9PEZI|nr:hypothetical protein B0A50_08797 [Salinomyces thailandica]
MPPSAPHTLKRKQPASTPSSSAPNKRAKPSHHHQQKRRDARQLSTQTRTAAFHHGELDVDKYVKSREYEIRALEEGLQRSKKGLNQRAFQLVPKDLRRRTASHNVKRVPQRLQERGKREMADDKTPTVTARRRKKSGPMRLRLETVRKLRALGSSKKQKKEDKKNEKNDKASDSAAKTTQAIPTRRPKVKPATLSRPSTPPAKFRKRQRHKSWLPTHLFHAKRARMTIPSAPLWRFAIPLSPTAKSHRPTHRARSERGCVAWDMSYMATIALEGREDRLLWALKGVGVEEERGGKGGKWIQGLRTRTVVLKACEGGMLAPATVIWCAPASRAESEKGERVRQVWIRVHPAAFLQVWEEVVKLAKTARPQVKVEDLRFEVGSIEISGPGATEALAGALWAFPAPDSNSSMASNSGEKASNLTAATTNNTRPLVPIPTALAETLQALAPLTNPSLLPGDALLAFNIQDPRLHHPPRRRAIPAPTAENQAALLNLCATWPPDIHLPISPPQIFSRAARQAAQRGLRSQKAINRRRALVGPGEVPGVQAGDTGVPVLLYTNSPNVSAVTSSSSSSSSSYTLLLPPKALPAVWYSIMYTPLSTGQQPRFAGLDELRWGAFESGGAWFPGDFPGTEAGWAWEVGVRRANQPVKPKAKQAKEQRETPGCAWEKLLQPKDDGTPGKEGAAPRISGLTQVPPALALKLFPHQHTTTKASPPPALPPTLDPEKALLAVHLTLLTRGVPNERANIYRLPRTQPRRDAWLALYAASRDQRSSRKRQHSNPNTTLREAKEGGGSELPEYISNRRLAHSLLHPSPPPQAGEANYPDCPCEEDLIGFITTGGFSLAGGKGRGVGNLVLSKIRSADGEGTENRESARLCIVRNIGEKVGRLGAWEVVGAV